MFFTLASVLPFTGGILVTWKCFKFLVLVLIEVFFGLRRVFCPYGLFPNAWDNECRSLVLCKIDTLVHKIQIKKINQQKPRSTFHSLTIWSRLFLKPTTIDCNATKCSTNRNLNGSITIELSGNSTTNIYDLFLLVELLFVILLALVFQFITYATIILIL